MFERSKAREPERVEHQSKWSRRYHRMVKLARSVLQRSLQIFHFQIGHLFENLSSRKPRGKKIQHVDNSNAHAAYTKPASTLLRICGDALHQASHGALIPRGFGQVLWPTH